MRYALLALVMLPLCGCVGIGTRGDMGASDNTTISGPVIRKQDPTERLEDKQRDENTKRELKEEIVASSNATRNQMSGLITTSVSKLGEIVKGVEANLSELVKVEATLNASARADLQTAIKLVTDLKVELNNTMTVTTKVADKMDSLLSVNAEMNLKLGNIQTTMQGQASGNAGWRNKLEQKLDNSVQTFMSKAGRDVNMLPKNAVDTMIGMAEKAVAMLAVFSALFSLAICLAFRYSRKRANQRFEVEKAEKDFMHQLLLSALTHVPPERALAVEQQLKTIPKPPGLKTE